MRLIVSGGIGSGKSTVLGRLRELGASVIEADVVGHEVLEPGGEAFDAVARRWPAVVVDGVIDRASLAEVVFQDAAALAELESMTHPAIARRILSGIEHSDAPMIAVELPVGSELLGIGWAKVVVEAPDEVRVARAVARGMEEDDVRNRMRMQPAGEEGRQGAAFVIVNDGTEEDLYAAVDEMWARLTGRQK